MTSRIARAEPPQLIRILTAEFDLLEESFVEQVHTVTRPGTWVVAITPPTILESDLLKTAAKYPFDIAMLVVNNISYSPDESSSDEDRIVYGASALVATIVRTFARPVIAFYGWPTSNTFQRRLVDSGAVAAFALPCSCDDIQQALTQALLRN